MAGTPPAGANPVPTSDLPPLIPTRGLQKEARLALFLDQFDMAWRSLLRNEFTCESQVPPSDSCDPGRWSMAVREFLSTPDYVDVLWRRRAGVRSPALALRLSNAWSASLGEVTEQEPYLRQLHDVLEDTVSTFRPDVGGILVTREQAREIMRRDEDRARRRAAFECGAPLSQKIAPDLLELFRRRNFVARRFGYRDFTELSLGRQGLSPAQLESLEDSVELLTREPYRALLARIRARLGVFQLHAWDLIYGQSQLDAPRDTLIRGADARARLLSYAAGLGIDVDSLPVRIHPIPEAPYGARMVPLDAPREISLIINPGNGLDGHISLFHEYGRALLEAHLPDSRPSARMLPEVWQETAGNLFGELAVERAWLIGGLGLSDSVAWSCRQNWLDSRLISLRSLLMLSRFERLVYQRPSANPDSLWKDFTERYLEVEAPEASMWGASLSLLSQPFVYTRYLVAEVASAQLLAAMRARCGRAEGGCAGRFLVEDVLKPSAAKPWTAVLERASGSPLSGRYLAQELQIPW